VVCPIFYYLIVNIDCSNRLSYMYIKIQILIEVDVSSIIIYFGINSDSNKLLYGIWCYYYASYLEVFSVEYYFLIGS